MLKNNFPRTFNILKKLLYLLVFTSFLQLNAQLNQYNIEASFSSDLTATDIKQSAVFVNSTSKNLTKIYLNDWSHAFSSTKTPLANHFAEEFTFRFQRSASSKRGATSIHKITDKKGNPIRWKRLEDQPDIIELELAEELKQKASLEIFISYKISFPSDKFTRFGVSDENNAHLSFWYLTFAGTNTQGWILDSHKNLDDLYVELSDFDVSISLPNTHMLVTDFPFTKSSSVDSNFFSGKAQRKHIPLHIVENSNFKNFVTPSTIVITDLSKDLSDVKSQESVRKVSQFLNFKLGNYPFDKLLISSIDYEKRPIYGLNRLPKFIRPFEDDFLFELSLLKVMTLKYFENTAPIHLRKDSWAVYGIQIYLLMEYVNQHYPDQKLLGKFSSFWGLKNYNLSHSSFNKQYEVFHKFSLIKNVDQALTTPMDKLTRYNAELSSRYKAGLGLRLLDNYLGKHIVSKSILNYYSTNSLKTFNKATFQSILQEQSKDSLSWFFDEFIASRNRVDYKLSSVLKNKDSINIIIKNKTNSQVPIPVLGLKNDSVVYKKWVHPHSEIITINLPNVSIDEIVLNKEHLVPETNYRNNHKRFNTKIFTKPIHFSFLKDIEDPSHTQIFYVPKLNYNLYDGLSPGIVLSNKTLVPQNFEYKLQPFFSTKEKSLVGSATLSYFKNHYKKSHYRTHYWLTGSRFHYLPGLFFKNIVPSVLFSFRDQNFRANNRHFLNFRYVYVDRDFSTEPTTDPDYGIFNIRYSFSNQKATKSKTLNANIEFKNSFTKIHTSYRYRNFFKDDYQFNFRLFAGAFLKNQTNDDYFSFGISSIQDYLFEHRLLGRSESEGFYSQQFVWADAGFKSKINAPLANQWLVSLNTGVSIWKWVELYGDVALIKRKHQKLTHGYDTGIHLNLVDNYFQLFFPVYSSDGLEINQSQYADKIRFVIVLDMITLSKLITRKWL